MARVDRRLIAIVAAGALVVITILVIVFMAIIPIPEYLPLQPGQHSGYVAYQTGNAQDSEAIEIVNLETLTRVLADVDSDVDLIGWHADGRLVVRDWRAGDGYVLVDPATGEETGSMASEQFEHSWPGDASVGHQDGKVVIDHPDGEGSASFVAPESYDIHSSAALGDDHIVFIDEMGRVAVTELGADVTPLLVTSDAREWSHILARP